MRTRFIKGVVRTRFAKGQPTPGDVHTSTPLTNISIAYVQNASAFIADKVFPIIPVAKQSDLYYKFDKYDFLRDEAELRAPATESAGGGFTLTTDSYSCKVEAFHKDIDDQLRANADSVLQLDRAAAEFVMQKMLIRRERRWMTAFFGSGIWSTDVTPGTLWSASTGSTPKKDVETGKMAILKATGFMPNTLVLGAEVFSALTDNDKIRDQFKYTSAESIDVSMMARFFGIDRVLVSTGIYANSNEGATGTTAFVAGKHALLCYTTNSPSLMQPTAGYTFGWSGLGGSQGTGIRTKKIRSELTASDRIEAEMSYDMKKVAAEMGYFFANVVS